MPTTKLPLSPKEAALQMMQQLPDDASYEDIQYKLYVLEKLADGLRAVEQGEVVSHDEAAQQLRRWLHPSSALPLS